MTWSPQQYLQDGLALGAQPELLERALSQIESVVVPHPKLPALLTLNHLAVRTGVPYKALRDLVSRSEESYRHFRIRKRTGGHRVISIPAPTLMTVQRWIASYMLNELPVHHCSFAFKPESSIQKCASRHSGARWLIKLDVAGFFGSISEIQVYRVFRSLGYQPLISFELTRLTTLAPTESLRYRKQEWQANAHFSPIESYGRRRIGYLPQGAPTSPMLSNLVMRKLDERIESEAKKERLRYTRYSDDLTFSTLADFDRRRAKKLIWKVTALLREIGLHVNTQKTTVVPPGARKVVLGLLVDGSQPRLTRDFRDTLRQHLHFLEKFGPFEHAKSRGFDSIGGMYRHVRGLIDYAKMIDPQFANEMLMRFKSVAWVS